MYGSVQPFATNGYTHDGQCAFYASQATQKHRGVQVTQMPDAEQSPGKRAKAACDGYLKLLARDVAQFIRVDRWRHQHAGY